MVIDVIQGHWQCHYLMEHIRGTISYSFFTEAGTVLWI